MPVLRGLLTVLIATTTPDESGGAARCVARGGRGAALVPRRTAGYDHATRHRGPVHRRKLRAAAIADCLRITTWMLTSRNLDTLAGVRDNPQHVFVRGDIGDRALVSRLLAEHQPDGVVNFAAESHVDRSIDGPAAFVHTNVVGTLALLEATRDYWRQLDETRRERFRFLHVSTDEVYGSLGDSGKFTETTPYAPNSPYSASKAASDHLVRAFHHTYGLPTLTTNCSNNYGPYQFPEKLIPLIIAKALHGAPLPVYGDGRNVRDWMFVVDHCSAIRAVLERGRVGEVYNVGGDAERENLHVVRTLCALVDERRPRLDGTRRESQITFVQDRPGHDRAMRSILRRSATNSAGGRA